MLQILTQKLKHLKKSWKFSPEGSDSHTGLPDDTLGVHVLQWGAQVIKSPILMKFDCVLIFCVEWTLK